MPAPSQAPLQPVKVESAAGFAVRVTGVPAEYVAKHVVPHWMPAGLEDIARCSALARGHEISASAFLSASTTLGGRGM